MKTPKTPKVRKPISDLLQALAAILAAEAAVSPLASALAVVVRTPHIRNYLERYDTKALEQAEAALKLVGYVE